MTREEKKKKAILVAVAHYLEQEKAALASTNENAPNKTWLRTGKEMIMNKRTVIQRRGRLLRTA